jgi:hypothetical protein
MCLINGDVLSEVSLEVATGERMCLTNGGVTIIALSCHCAASDADAPGFPSLTGDPERDVHADSSLEEATGERMCLTNGGVTFIALSCHRGVFALDELPYWFFVPPSCIG